MFNYSVEFANILMIYFKIDEEEEEEEVRYHILIKGKKMKKERDCFKPIKYIDIDRINVIV